MESRCVADSLYIASKLIEPLAYCSAVSECRNLLFFVDETARDRGMRPAEVRAHEPPSRELPPREDRPR